MARRIRVAARSIRRGRRIRCERTSDLRHSESFLPDTVSEPAVKSPALRSSTWRPKAPAFELAPAPVLAAAPVPGPLPADEECDPLATTLESARDFSPIQEPASTKRDGAWVRVEQAPAAVQDDAGDLDGDFFRDSCPPVVADLELDEPSKVVLLTPAEASRRASFRRGVGIAVGTVGMLAVALSVKAAVSTIPVGTARHQTVAAAVVAQKAPVETRTDRKSRASAEQPKPTVTASFKEIARETLQMLNTRDHERAAELARQLITLEPDNAFGYRCLGAALQDAGKTSAARKAYSNCVRKATRGLVVECAALGGRAR